MLLKEINAINFRSYGAVAQDTASFADAQQILYEDDVRISSVLWHYDMEVLVEPVSGVGIIFIRSTDGVIHRFLLDQSVIINPGVEFCILPYECKLSYRLYTRSERLITPITNVLTGTGFVPSINVKTLYTVLYQEKNRQFSFRGEQHPFWEFTYVNKGNMVCEVDGQTFELKQGQMIFFAPHQFHVQRSDGKNPLSFLTVTFDGDIVHPDTIMGRTIYADDACLKIIQGIIREEREGGLYSDDMIVCDITKLLITVLRNVRSDSVITRVPTKLKVSVDNSYISECIEVIHQHITDTITLPWLAKQLNLSPSYLSSLFKQKVGRSISEYIRLVRLEKVKDMIGEGRYTIAQISDIMGYCSPTYLSTEFKREFQMSPKEYAKMIS